MPAAIYSKDGKRALLSWRVAMLPFLEQEKLYKEFKLDEAWDSDHNKKLIAKMPDVFKDPSAPPSKEPGMTHYQVFVGGGSAFRLQPQSCRLFDITDGTSNTIMGRFRRGGYRRRKNDWLADCDCRIATR